MALDNKVHIIAEFLRDNVITHTDLAEYLCNHFTADERRWMSRRLSDIDKFEHDAVEAPPRGLSRSQWTGTPVLPEWATEMADPTPPTTSRQEGGGEDWQERSPSAARQTADEVEQHNHAPHKLTCCFCAEVGLNGGAARPNDLKRHFRSHHHAPHVWLCFACPYISDGQSALKVHVKEKHKDKTLAADWIAGCQADIRPQVLYACGFRKCKQVFDARSKHYEGKTKGAEQDYWTHILQHNDEEQWSFSRRFENLVKHSFYTLYKQYSKEAREKLEWNPGTATLAKKMMECQTVDKKAGEAFVAYVFMLGSPPYNSPGGQQLRIPDGLTMPTIDGGLPKSFKEHFCAFPEDKLSAGDGLYSACNGLAGPIQQRPRSSQDSNNAAADADGDVAMIQDFPTSGIQTEPAVWPPDRTCLPPFSQEYGSIRAGSNEGKEIAVQQPAADGSPSSLYYPHQRSATRQNEMSSEPVIGPEDTLLPGAYSMPPAPSTPSTGLFAAANGFGQYDLPARPADGLMPPWSAGGSGNGGSMGIAGDVNYNHFTSGGTTNARYINHPERWAGSSTSMEGPNVHNDGGSGRMVMNGVMAGTAVTAPPPRGWSQQTPQAPRRRELVSTSAHLGSSKAKEDLNRQRR